MTMCVIFKPLKREHFPLLLKWLETPHVKKWWDSDINWTLELIEKKYSSYTQGFKHLVLETKNQTHPTQDRKSVV